MARYIDPNSGAAPQPGGEVRARPASPVTPPKDSLTLAEEQGAQAVAERVATTELVEDDDPTEDEPTDGEGEATNGDPSDEGQSENAEAVADDAGDEAEVETKADPLSNLSRDELIDIATEREVRGRHQMNRDELIAAIRDGS